MEDRASQNEDALIWGPAAERFSSKMDTFRKEQAISQAAQ
jgi:hypothetical protein